MIAIQNSIQKYSPPPPKVDFDSFLLAMFLMYARAPRKPEPEIDGFFSLGEIGQDREKDWERLTPYSPARREVKPCSSYIEIAG